MAAYAVKLDLVPGLSQLAKGVILKFLKNKKMGANNTPRSFSTPDLAEQGIVSFTKHACTLHKLFM